MNIIITNRKFIDTKIPQNKNKNILILNKYTIVFLNKGWESVPDPESYIFCLMLYCLVLSHSYSLSVQSFSPIIVSHLSSINGPSGGWSTHQILLSYRSVKKRENVVGRYYLILGVISMFINIYYLTFGCVRLLWNRRASKNIFKSNRVCSSNGGSP